MTEGSWILNYKTGEVYWVNYRYSKPEGYTMVCEYCNSRRTAFSTIVQAWWCMDCGLVWTPGEE